MGRVSHQTMRSTIQRKRRASSFEFRSAQIETHHKLTTSDLLHVPLGWGIYPPTQSRRAMGRSSLRDAPRCAQANPRQRRSYILDITTQAQRPGTRDAMIANRDAMPGSLQRMVRPRCHGLGRVELLLVSTFEKATIMSPIPEPLNESGPESNLCHVVIKTSIFAFARP